MKPFVSANLMFHATVKAIWEAARATYSLKNNAFRVFEVYENVFNLRHGDRSLLEYYNQF